MHDTRERERFSRAFDRFRKAITTFNEFMAELKLEQGTGGNMAEPNPKSVESRAREVLERISRDVFAMEARVPNREDFIKAIVPLLRTAADERVLQAAKAWAVTCEVAHSLELRNAVDAHPTLTPPAPKLPVWEVKCNREVYRDGKWVATFDDAFDAQTYKKAMSGERTK
jgi:hypothetical protein